MPKKNSIINKTIPEEQKILFEDETPEKEIEPPPEQIITKPKRQISDAQREHLNNIRSKALEKKAEMKEETLKAKLAKTIEKKELVKNMMNILKKKRKKKRQNHRRKKKLLNQKKRK